MVFRRCSVAGKSYNGREDPAHTIAASHVAEESHAERSNPAGSDPPPAGTVEKIKLSDGVLTHFQDDALDADLREAARNPNSDQSHLLREFFTCLALCHSALASFDPETGAISYKAQSPDESALVQAAADVGFIFQGRDREVLRLQTPFQTRSTPPEEWELLNVLDFTSARKRMSVVLKRKDERSPQIYLYSKGADNVIFERLAAGHNEWQRKTEDHLDEFASAGLRTLCLAYKVVDGMSCIACC